MQKDAGASHPLLTIRLSDAGARCLQTKLIYPHRRRSPWFTEVAPRRSLESIVRGPLAQHKPYGSDSSMLYHTVGASFRANTIVSQHAKAKLNAPTGTPTASKSNPYPIGRSSKGPYRHSIIRVGTITPTNTKQRPPTRIAAESATVHRTQWFDTVIGQSAAPNRTSNDQVERRGDLPRQTEVDLS
jgi:hypothetical protein